MILEPMHYGKPTVSSLTPGQQVQLLHSIGRVTSAQYQYSNSATWYDVTGQRSRGVHKPI